MIIQRRFGPIGGRFEPESQAGFAGICNIFDKDRAIEEYGI
jgi:hypothetical protein